MSFIKKKSEEAVKTPARSTAEVGVEDVVNFYTRLFRDPEGEGFRATDSMKAAEFFTKYYNMLDKDSDSEGTVIIVDDIRGADNG